MRQKALSPRMLRQLPLIFVWSLGHSDQKELATPERCRAYARLAAEVARSRTVAAEMALFLASGLLGATLPHYFDRNHWWELGAVGAVTGLGAGLRRRSLARDWQRRAATSTSEPAPTISARLTAYRQPPPRRDSPPYRRRPRCTPGGGGVGPPRRLSSATSRAAVSRACASADTGSRPRPSSAEMRCTGASRCSCSAALRAAAAWAARCWFSRSRVTASASAPSCASRANSCWCSPRPTNRAAVIATAAARSPWPACGGGGTRPHSSRACLLYTSPSPRD